MFYDLIKARKESPSEARINQLLEELFSADSERKSEDIDKGGALDYLKRHKQSARDALKGYGAEGDDMDMDMEKGKGSEDEDERSEERKAMESEAKEQDERSEEREAMESEAEEQGELFKDEDEGEDEDEDEGEDEDMKKGMDAKAKRRDLMSRAYSIIDDLSDEQLDEFLSAREVKKAQVMGVLSRLTTPELADFCSVDAAQGAQGSEKLSEG